MPEARRVEESREGIEALARFALLIVKQIVLSSHADILRTAIGRDINAKRIPRFLLLSPPMAIPPREEIAMANKRYGERRVGVLGSGDVGRRSTAWIYSRGHNVMIRSRDITKPEL